MKHSARNEDKKREKEIDGRTQRSRDHNELVLAEVEVSQLLEL